MPIPRLVVSPLRDLRYRYSMMDVISAVLSGQKRAFGFIFWLRPARGGRNNKSRRSYRTFAVALPCSPSTRLRSTTQDAAFDTGTTNNKQ